MKKLWREVCIAGFFGLVLPGVILHMGMSMWKSPYSESTIPPDGTQPTVTAQSLHVPVLMDSGLVETMALQDYLTGVVLAEMPASFEPEAKKAQTVVARTYALKAATQGGKHEQAAVCVDPGCCQSYLSEQEYLAIGGQQWQIEQVRELVAATEGQVLLYEGELIEATYFSCSGGRTEDAVAVWGTEVPYLQATDSPGEEGAVHNTDTVVFTKAQLEKALNLKLSGEPAGWIGKATYTDGGGIQTIVLGGKQFKGTELRTLLDLRSTAFTVSAAGEGLRITTRGFGHRVGMSQYGADAMAVKGSSYVEILAYYYRGTVLAEFQISND